VKSVRGGMTDIQFIAQYLMLRHANRHPEVLAANTTDALRRLNVAGVLPAAAADELIAAMRLYRRVQGFLRLAMDDEFDAAGAPAALRAALARATAGPGGAAIDFASAEQEIRDTAARVMVHYQEIVARPAAALPKDQETPAP
jgi:glutamate-ammonia-ligase adenylyltransferase